MGRVVHFEICADNVERAVKFYTDVFGWKINKWEGPIDYWLISTGKKSRAGIDGGLIKRMDPSATTINTIEVHSVDDYMDKITKGGGKIVEPKTVIPGVGYYAYCRDTEGNILGIMEMDEKAE